VARGDRILLPQGYGFADLALEAPAKDETVYHVVGPMLPFTGIAVMQQVERGNFRWTMTFPNSFWSFRCRAITSRCGSCLTILPALWTTTTWAIPLKPPAGSLKLWMK